MQPKITIPRIPIKPSTQPPKSPDFQDLSVEDKIIYLKTKIGSAEANINTLKRNGDVKRTLDNIVEWKRQLSMLTLATSGNIVDDGDDNMDIFDVITLNVKQVASKRSNALIITGDAGVGKTMTVIQAIAYLNPHKITEQVIKVDKVLPEDDSLKEPEVDIKVDIEVEAKPKVGIPKVAVDLKKIPPIKGAKENKVIVPTADSRNNIESGYYIVSGTCTCAALYEVLFVHRKKLIVFDDFDSVLKDPECVNLLKAALDTYPIREISKMTKGNTFNSFGMSDAQMQAIFEDEGKLPIQFKFTGNIIFISNIHEDKFDKALMSRSLHVEVRLTKAQLIERMHTLMPDIRPEAPMNFKIEALNHLEYITNHYDRKFDLNLREFIHAIDYRMQYPSENPENVVESKNGKKLLIWQQLLKKRIVKSAIIHH